MQPGAVLLVIQSSFAVHMCGYEHLHTAGPHTCKPQHPCPHARVYFALQQAAMLCNMPKCTKPHCQLNPKPQNSLACHLHNPWRLSDTAYQASPSTHLHLCPYTAQLCGLLTLHICAACLTFTAGGLSPAVMFAERVEHCKTTATHTHTDGGSCLQLQSVVAVLLDPTTSGTLTLSLAVDRVGHGTTLNLHRASRTSPARLL